MPPPLPLLLLHGSTCFQQEVHEKWKFTPPLIECENLLRMLQMITLRDEMEGIGDREMWWECQDAARLTDTDSMPAQPHQLRERGNSRTICRQSKLLLLQFTRQRQ